MPCENPLVCFRSGRKVFFSVPSAVQYGFSPSELEPFLVRCGHCLDCRIQHSRVWSARCVAEASTSPDNCFLTLTYSDMNLPKGGERGGSLAPPEAQDESAGPERSSANVGGEGGNCVPLRTDAVGSLQIEDLQKFWKRLRNSGATFRYFACGEYGPKTLRPHYHAIIFGWRPNDLEYSYVESENGLSRVASSKFLEMTWRLGHVSIGEVSPASCAYVARYCVKKLTERELGSRRREFIVMSRRPAIGSGFMKENRQSIFEYDAIFDGKRWSKPPRVFENFLSASELESLKERRMAHIVELDPGERRRLSDFVKEKWRKKSRAF